jgi:hypothetical protein
MLRKELGAQSVKQNVKQRGDFRGSKRLKKEDGG